MAKRFFGFSFSLTLLALFVFAACQNKTNQTKPVSDSVSAGNMAALRVALVPTTSCLPYLVAKSCRIYDSLGLPVEFVMCRDVSTCDRLLANRKADAAFTDVFRAVEMQQSGVDLGVVTGFDEELSLVVGRTTRLRRLASLTKRMVAIDRFSSADYLCDRVAAYARIDPEEIYRPQINDIVLRGRMLVNNQIEAAVLPQPWALCLNMQGHPALFSSKQLKQSYGILAARRKTYNAQRDRFIKLNEGYFMALKTLKRAPRSADSLLLNVYRLPAVTVDSLRKQTIPPPVQVDERMLSTAREWLKQRDLWKSDKRGLPALLR